MQHGTSYILLAFGLTVFGLMIWIANLNHQGDLIEATAQIGLLSRGIGLFLVTVGGLATLLRAWAGARPAAVLAPIPAVLAGALLMEPNWGTGLALGLVAVAGLMSLRNISSIRAAAVGPSEPEPPSAM